jgi:hypothetical protein
VADPVFPSGAAPVNGPARWGIRAIEIIIGVALMFWAMFTTPDDVTAAVACVLAPLLAVAWVAANGTGWILFETRSDTLPGLGMVVAGGALGIFLLAQRGGYLVDWIAALEMAAAVGAVFGAFSYVLNAGARSRLGSSAIAALAFVAWGYGLVSLLDVRMDKATPATEQVSVMSSYVTHGRHTSYNLRLGAWRWGNAGTTYGVSHRLYMAAAGGEEVCVTSGPGALKLRWSRVELCPTSVTPPSPVAWG